MRARPSRQTMSSSCISRQGGTTRESLRTLANRVAERRRNSDAASSEAIAVATSRPRANAIRAAKGVLGSALTHSTPCRFER